MLNLFSIDRQAKIFIKHNRKVWASRKAKNPETEILVDFYGVSQTVIAYSYFLNVLAEKHNACIKTFSKSNPSNNLALSEVYRSFNTVDYVVPVLSQEQEIRKREISQKIKQNIRTKKDVFEIRIMNVWIGIDIYESYLRYFYKPTVYLGDPRLFDLIDDAIGLLIFWTDYLEKDSVAAIVVSHDFTIHLNILCKAAYQKKIPVYLPNMTGISLSKSATPVCSARFKDYRTMFKKLSAEEQANGIKLAKYQLQRRFRGEIAVDMPYSTKSAFRQFDDKRPILKRNDKIKVLIYTHCFFDNPYIYGDLLFVDFYEWLRFLGEVSRRTDYDWYIKTHPDFLPGTMEIVKEFITEFANITLIPPETSHHQLIKEGVKFVLTAYGSVGHELPVLGVQVINAGHNPHIGYDFNWHPKSLEEYEFYLLNLANLCKKINKNDIYEFYYTHYYYTFADDLVLKSYRKFTEDLDKEKRNSSDVYGYFLCQFAKDKHREIINNMREFIDSGKQNYFSRGPE